MNKTIVTMAVALLAATGNLQARIGETMAESVQRYGQAIYVGPDSYGSLWYYFLKDGYRVDAAFGEDGQTIAIRYSRNDQALSGLTENEINNFLAAEGNHWKSVGLYSWQSSWGIGRMATYCYDQQTQRWCLQCISPKFSDRVTAYQNSQQKGF